VTYFQPEIPVPRHAINETLGGIVDGANVTNAVLLEPMAQLSAYFEAPVEGKLHLVVQVPLPSETQPFDPSGKRG
jgi:hypothetical protein